MQGMQSRRKAVRKERKKLLKRLCLEHVKTEGKVEPQAEAGAEGPLFRATRLAERTQPRLPGEAQQAPPCCHLKLLSHTSLFRKLRGTT